MVVERVRISVTRATLVIGTSLALTTAGVIALRVQHAEPEPRTTSLAERVTALPELTKVKAELSKTERARAIEQAVLLGSPVTGGAFAATRATAEVLAGDLTDDEAGYLNRRPRGPSVRFGLPSARGLDASSLWPVLRRSAPELRACYVQQLAAKPSLAGTLELSFVVEERGTVSSVRASGVDPEVARCVEGVVARLVFARSRTRGTVTYPLHFRR